MKYRINLGNGQVSRQFKSLRAAQAELDAAVSDRVDYAAWFRIQFQDNGDWFFMPPSSGLLGSCR